MILGHSEENPIDGWVRTDLEAVHLDPLLASDGFSSDLGRAEMETRPGCGPGGRVCGPWMLHLLLVRKQLKDMLASSSLDSLLLKIGFSEGREGLLLRLQEGRGKTTAEIIWNWKLREGLPKTTWRSTAIPMEGKPWLTSCFGRACYP